MPFEKLTTVRDEPLSPGDVFYYQLTGDQPRVGLVVDSGIKYGPDTVALVYLYKTLGSQSPAVPGLSELLLPPMLVYTLELRSGYFEPVMRVDLATAEVLSQHCFFYGPNLREIYVDQYGKELGRISEPLGLFAPCVAESLAYFAERSLRGESLYWQDPDYRRPLKSGKTFLKPAASYPFLDSVIPRPQAQKSMQDSGNSIRDQRPRQSVVISLRFSGTNLAPLHHLEDCLESELNGNALGFVDGNEVAFDRDDARIFIYGPDADAILKAIRPVLKKSPIAKNATITLRYGEDDDAPTKEVKLSEPRKGKRAP